jgi:hypothetical protein
VVSWFHKIRAFKWVNLFRYVADHIFVFDGKGGINDWNGDYTALREFLKKMALKEGSGGNGGFAAVGAGAVGGARGGVEAGVGGDGAGIGEVLTEEDAKAEKARRIEVGPVQAQRS